MTYNPNAGGTPTVATVTGLTAALAAKADTVAVVLTNDSRLSDARTPTAHSHAYASLTGLPTLGTAAAQNVGAFATAAQGVDARTPLTHSHTQADVTGLVAALAALTPTVSATSATTGAMTVTMGEGVRTITPTGACTFNASGGVAGQRCTFAITTAGASSFVLTWGTNFRRVGTLATGTTAARFFSVTFVCIVTNGVWQETGRTAAQT